MGKTIFFLVKIFDQEKYALDFINGKLFANRLSYFRGLEEQQSANRGDINEGVISWFQPDQINIQLNGRTLTDLAGPVSVKMNMYDQLNVFCIYAAHSGEFEELTEENLLEFKKQLDIPEDCLHLGKYAVLITNFTKFIERVKEATIKNNYGLSAGLVDYYDPDVFSGTFSESEAIFRKQNKYSHQKEYRFAFDTGISGNTPLLLDVGDLSDITLLCDVKDVNNLLEIKLSTNSESEIA